jgi:hypothetical protein
LKSSIATANEMRHVDAERLGDGEQDGEVDNELDGGIR